MIGYVVVLIGLLLHWVTPAHAAITIVQSTAKTTVNDSRTGSVAFAATPTKGNQIVVTAASLIENPDPGACAFFYNGQPMSGVTSAPSGFWSDRAYVMIYPLVTDQAGTATVSVSCPGSETSADVTFMGHEVAGLVPGLFDVSTSTAGVGSSGSLSGTATSADALAVAVVAYDLGGTATVTPSAGWTQRWEQETCTSLMCGNAVDKILSSPGTISHTWTLGQSVPYSAVLVSFPASQTPGGSQPVTRQLSWIDNAHPDADGLNDEDGFTIEKRTPDTAPNWIVAGSVGTDVTTFVTSITPSEAAGDCWRVRAFNTVGSSAYSNIACSTVSLPQPCPRDTPGTAITRALTGAHPTNPLYFTDANGCAIYLTGSHTWQNLQDHDSYVFDYSGYLDTLAANGHNLIRLWVAESPSSDDGYTIAAVGYTGGGDLTHIANVTTPQAWNRSATCCAHDGGNKWDLTSYNSAYFTRLHDRIEQAQNRGIYVMVMLFNAIDSDSQETWKNHPFKSENNVNSVNGDPNADGLGKELFQSNVPAAAFTQQKNYVHHVIDTLDDLNNVIYEVVNESELGVAWQNLIIDDAISYMGGKTHQFPLCLTARGGTVYSTTDLTTGNHGACTAPGAVNYDSPSDPLNSDPPVPSGKIFFMDSDHTWYSAGRSNPPFARQWVWKSFMRGYSPLLMDGWDQASGWVEGRRAQGDTRKYADRLTLGVVTPQSSICSTGYCLASTGYQYLVYQPGSGSFTVSLAAGDYAVEWFNPASGQVTSTGMYTASGGTATFTPPSSGEAVLLLQRQTSQPPPPPPPPPPSGVMITLGLAEEELL